MYIYKTIIFSRDDLNSSSSDLVISCNLTISNALFLIILFSKFFGNILSILFNSSSSLLERIKNFKAPTCFSVCFSKVFPKGEYVNLACSFIWLRVESNVSSALRNSCLSIFSDDNSNIFVASLLISYWSFDL